MAVNSEMEKLVSLMDKKFGIGALREFSEDALPVEALSTGIASFDVASGIGGLPRGRIVELFGPEAAGKTAIAIKVMASAQQLAGTMPRNASADSKPFTGRVGLLDVEHSFNPVFASEVLGLKIGKNCGFFFDQPMGGDEALQKLEFMINSGLFDVIVIDSVAGLTTLDDQKKDIGEQVIAGTARLMSSALRKLVSLVSKSHTVVIFINQIREKPAVTYGSNETTPGGRALKFYSSMRIRVAKGEGITENRNYVGHMMKLSIRKNKVAPPYTKTEVPLYYTDNNSHIVGFDTDGDLINAAIALKLVSLRGSTYYYMDDDTGEVFIKAAGLVKFKQALYEDPSIIKRIKSDVLSQLQNEKEEAKDGSENK